MCFYRTVKSPLALFEKKIIFMKKNFLLFWLSLAFCPIASGQKLQIELHSGLGKAQLLNFITNPSKGSNAEWMNSRTEGLSFTYYFGKRLGLCVEATYTVKGNRFREVDNKGYFYQMPVMLKHDFFESDSKKVVMYGKFGPYVGFLHRQQLFELKFRQDYFKEYSQYNDFDFGLGLGLGAGFLLDTNIRLNLELRAERGLAHVYIVSYASEKKNTHIAGWAILGISYTIPSPYLK